MLVEETLLDESATILLIPTISELSEERGVVIDSRTVVLAATCANDPDRIGGHWWQRSAY